MVDRRSLAIGVFAVVVAMSGLVPRAQAPAAPAAGAQGQGGRGGPGGAGRGAGRGGGGFGRGAFTPAAWSQRPEDSPLQLDLAHGHAPERHRVRARSRRSTTTPKAAPSRWTASPAR